MQQRFNGVYQLLVNKYYADDFNEVVFAGGARGVGQLLWKIGDVLIIDGLIVNGPKWSAGRQVLPEKFKPVISIPMPSP
jgi:NADH-quinone oxidoreductase subunit L